MMGHSCCLTLLIVAIKEATGRAKCHKYHDIVGSVIAHVHASIHVCVSTLTYGLSAAAAQATKIVRFTCVTVMVLCTVSSDLLLHLISDCITDYCAIRLVSLRALLW